MGHSSSGLWSLYLAIVLPEKNGNTSISVFLLHNANLEVFRIGFITPSNAQLQQLFKHTGTTIH